MSKLLPIINLALTGIILIVMIIVLVQVGSIRSTMVPETPKDENGQVMIPLSQLEEVSLGEEDEQFILKLNNEETGKTANVVLKVGVAIDTKHKGAEEAKEVLTSQGRIVRDRIYSILVSKDLSYYKDYTKQEALKSELVIKFQELIGNEAVVDVYFNNLIVSE